MAGNWKMHKTVGEAVELARAIRAGIERGRPTWTWSSARPSPRSRRWARS